MGSSLECAVPNHDFVALWWDLVRMGCENFFFLSDSCVCVSLFKGCVYL